MTATSKRSARARARRAGRTYPSLVDNMKSPRKRTTTSRRKRSTTRARRRS